MDFSKMSDADLEKIAGGGTSGSLDFSKMSDEELEAIAGPTPLAPGEEKPALQKVGETYDSYAGAPVRSAVSAAQQGRSPVDAFVRQFGADPSTAPTGKQIAVQAGLDDSKPFVSGQKILDTVSAVAPMAGPIIQGAGKFLGIDKAQPSKADLVGVGLDAVLDVTNLVPGAGVAKNLLKGTKTAGDVAQAASTTSKTAKVLSSAGEALTGVPKKNIETYAKHTDEINRMIKSHGGDISSMSDEVREGFNKSIQSTKSGLNKTIDDTLAAMPENQSIDVSWAKDELSFQRNKLRPALDKDAIREIDDLSSTIDELAPDGKISVQELNALKRHMQGQAEGSYLKDGQIFNRGKQAQLAAKNVGARARKLLNQMAPEVAQANNTLSRLHSLEQKMNKNLIAAGKSENALVTAGAGTNSRNAKNLEELSKITGSDMVGQAEKLSAAKTFAKPPVLPMDATGKTVARMAVGYAIGGVPGVVITSPMTLKVAINAGKIPKSILRGFGGGGKVTTAESKAIFDRMNSPKGRKLLTSLGQAARVSSIHSASPVSKKTANDGDTNIAELRGRDKWAFDGFAKVAGSDPIFQNEAAIEKMFSSQKGKTLLSQASGLKPGTKAMDDVLKKIKKDFGNEK